MSSIGKSKATAVNHEWEIDALAAPAANNYHLEGDEIAFDAQTTTLSALRGSFPGGAARAAAAFRVWNRTSRAGCARGRSFG